MTESIELATALTIAWLGNSHTRASADDVPTFLQSMVAAVEGLTAHPTEPEAAPAEYPRAVTARKSLASPDHIISMIDGKPYRTLRRHLTTNGLTPAEYRDRYGLKADYPMVAPSYSEARRETAHRLGLGRKRKAEPEAATAKRGRRKKATAEA